jgi:hypothetical protein
MATRRIGGGMSFAGGLATVGRFPMIASSGANSDLEDSPLGYATGVISSAEILALNTTPKELVPAPGAGKVLTYRGGLFIQDYGIATYANGAVLIVKQENASGVAVSDSIAASLLTTAADRIHSSIPIAGVALVANKALVLTTATAFITGDGVLRFKVFFAIHETGL